MGLREMKVYQNLSNAVYGMCKDVLCRNYPYALSVEIPPHKDIDTVMHKLRTAYVRYEQSHQRSRARQRGEAVFRVIAVPSERIAWIAATEGHHPYFFKNPNLRDIRKSWVTFGAYKIKRPKKARIEVIERVYSTALETIRGKSLRATPEELEEMIRNLKWFKSSDTYRQKRMIAQAVNRQRKIHNLPLLDLTHL